MVANRASCAAILATAWPSGSWCQICITAQISPATTARSQEAGELPSAGLDLLSQRGAAGDLQQAFDEAVEIGLDELVDAAEVGDVSLSRLPGVGVPIGPGDLQVGPSVQVPMTVRISASCRSSPSS